MSGIVQPLLGGIQATVSVILTITFGVAFSQFGLLDADAASKISKTSVKVLLPCLLINNLGSQLKPETAYEYVPIIIWAIIYNVLSIFLGRVLCKVFNLPRWTIPAIAFNNTTSLPLLLIESLETAGVLGPLVAKGEGTSEAVTRARTYFLVSAVVSHALTFGLGGSELKGDDEDLPEDTKNQNHNEDDAPRQRYRDDPEAQEDDDDDDDSSDSAPETSLLPHAVHHRARRINKRTHTVVHNSMEKLPSFLQTAITAVYNFVTPPLVGAIIGGIIGFAPPLHTLFFADGNEGGYFNAWLTQSIKNIGQLFVTLQVVVVGVKLAQALRREKRGEDCGTLNWVPVTIVVAVRYFIWPVISVGLVYAIAAKTSWLPENPMLWFVMMLMPTGPSAMKVMVLADVAGAEQKDKMVIAKFLAVIYAVSPLMTLTVIGGLKACSAAM
ncbi:auxin efflux carrier [Boeremia exigua]|uniref:auxin efflux carrier n=1 Tax=Boeremia exigua TaxID=749465 RepID=UPI001E8D3A86|nr:auxin efflux carrier [Boeremia exigua]KAH6644429.1 auxin efflux carrier [Boeremia exigua]